MHAIFSSETRTDDTTSPASNRICHVHIHNDNPDEATAWWLALQMQTAEGKALRPLPSEIAAFRSAVDGYWRTVTINRPAWLPGTALVQLNATAEVTDWHVVTAGIEQALQQKGMSTVACACTAKPAAAQS